MIHFLINIINMHIYNTHMIEESHGWKILWNTLYTFTSTQRKPTRQARGETEKSVNNDVNKQQARGDELSVWNPYLGIRILYTTKTMREASSPELVPEIVMQLRQ